MKDYSNISVEGYIRCFVAFPFYFLKRGNMGYTSVPWNDLFYEGEREKLAKKFKQIEEVSPHATISSSYIDDE